MASDKVVPLSVVANKGKPPQFLPLDDDTIKALENAVRLGKEGKVLALAVTYAWVEDGEVNRTSALRYSGGQIVYLCGLVAVLHKRVQLLEDKT